MQVFHEIATLVHKCQKKEENILSVPLKTFKFQNAIINSKYWYEKKHQNNLNKEEFISPS